MSSSPSRDASNQLLLGLQGAQDIDEEGGCVPRAVFTRNSDLLGALRHFVGVVWLTMTGVWCRWRGLRRRIS